MTNVDLLSLLFIAVGLSADCFAVALSGSCAMKSLTRFQILRASLSFGLFQAVMPALGWLAGRTLVNFIGSFDHWLAFALLGFVGGKMVWESFHPEREDENKKDFTRGWLLLTLSIATSSGRTEFCLPESQYRDGQSGNRSYRFPDHGYRLFDR